MHFTGKVILPTVSLLLTVSAYLFVMSRIIPCWSQLQLSTGHYEENHR